MKVLAWIGRQGTRGVAATLAVSLIPNPLGPLLKPVLPAAIFVFLVIAFLRVDLDRAGYHARRPALIAAFLAWIMLATPLLVGAAVHALHIGRAAPGLDVGLVLMAAAPPILSAPAFAYLLGLDGALSLTVLVASVILTPLSAPLVAALVLPDALPLSALALTVRLGLLLSGAAGVAVLLRRALGDARVQAAREEVDGLNILILLVFALALMDGVAARLLADPALVLGILLLACALSALLMAGTMLLFGRLAKAEAVALALSAGNRNMGLMLAALGGDAPDLTWLYFALGQVPVYVAPYCLQPLVRRTLR